MKYGSCGKEYTNIYGSNRFMTACEPRVMEAGLDRALTGLYDFVPVRQQGKSERSTPDKLLRPRDAAVALQISYPTIKQWIYHHKVRAVKTPGGHYRIPQAEIDRLLYRAQGHNKEERRVSYQRISGRNQLVGRIVDVRVSGLVAQVTLSVGGQSITSLITSGAVREMGLKKGQTAAALIKATEVMIIRV